MKNINKVLIMLACLFSANKVLASCEISIDSNDAMQFSKQKLSVPSSCKTVKLTLNHTGKLPKKIMGHNWVLSDTADVKDVAMDGMRAGESNKYVKAGDTRVYAFSDVIGGGETTTLEFSTSKLTANGDYTFFCSFPGHFGIMKGKFEFI